MAGKRKRGQETTAAVQNQNSANVNGKPISAIAAARLKAEAAAQGIPIVDDVQETARSPLSDSTESDLAESELEEDIPLVPQNFKLCTWRNIGSNILSDTDEELTIGLEKHATISFVGCSNVKVLKGAVNINGANLGAAPRRGEQSRTHRLFVPSTHPITRLRGLDHTNHVQFLSCKEPTPFARLSPLFADIWAGNESRKRSFELITESDADPLKRPLVPENAPEDWHRAVEDIASTPSITMTIGPSLVGKSTFAKRLLNRYLTGLGKTAKGMPSVCFLDLDPSNPEYTTQGQASLTIVRRINLGPPFTYSSTTTGIDWTNETITAHPIPFGALTNYENYFKSCVENLLHTHQNTEENIASPLIINTSAALYTTHFPLLQSLLAIFKPNHIVHLGNTTAIDEEIAAKLHALQISSTKTGSNLHELTAQAPPLPPQRSKSELRAMQMQSYFHSTSTKTPITSSQEQDRLPEGIWDSRPLSTITPWEFCYEETDTRTQDLIGFLTLFEPISSSQLLTALNGSIVHILETSDADIQARWNELPRTPRSRIPYFSSNASTGMTEPLDPRTSRLICTALVRGFDPDNRIVQIIVPKAHESVLRNLAPQRTVFVAGCCDTPEWAYAEDAYQQLNDRKDSMASVERLRGEDALVESMQMPPWVERKSVVQGIGYLNTVRRVRKFLG